MAKNITKQTEQYEKDFIELAQSLTSKHDIHTVWRDLITMFACERSTIPSFSDTKSKMIRRTKMSEEIMAKYADEEFNYFDQIFDIILDAIESNPSYDFLDAVAHKLNIITTSSKSTKISTVVSPSIIEAKQQIATKGYFPVVDSSINTGSELLALANTYKKESINCMNSVLFVGQDTDQTAALTAYIKLTILGYSGRITILKEPTSAIPCDTLICDTSAMNIWCTPMYLSPSWAQLKAIEEMVATMPDPSLFTVNVHKVKKQ